MAAANPDPFTLIDLRPWPLVFGQRHEALDADLVHTIHGFDALLAHRIDGVGKPLALALHTLLASSFGLAG
jgi:hypothetical protein